MAGDSAAVVSSSSKKSNFIFVVGIIVGFLMGIVWTSRGGGGSDSRGTSKGALPTLSATTVAPSSSSPILEERKNDEQHPHDHNDPKDVEGATIQEAGKPIATMEPRGKKKKKEISKPTLPQPHYPHLTENGQVNHREGGGDPPVTTQMVATTTASSKQPESAPGLPTIVEPTTVAPSTTLTPPKTPSPLEAGQGWPTDDKYQLPPEELVRRFDSSPALPSKNLPHLSKNFFLELDGNLTEVVKKQEAAPNAAAHVLFTTISGGSYGPLLEELALTLKKFGRLEQLFVFCMDQNCIDQCRREGWQGILISYSRKQAVLDGGKCGKHCLGDAKIAFSHRLASWYVSFIFLDLDVFFRHDPFLPEDTQGNPIEQQDKDLVDPEKYFLRLSDPSWYIQVQLDHLPPTPYTLHNFGFFYQRGCEKSRNLWNKIYQHRVAHPQSWDQSHFDDGIRSPGASGTDRFEYGRRFLSRYHWINFMNVMFKGMKDYDAQRMKDFWIPMMSNYTIIHMTCVESPELRKHMKRLFFGFRPGETRETLISEFSYAQQLLPSGGVVVGNAKTDENEKAAAVTTTPTHPLLKKPRILSVKSLEWNGHRALCLMQQRLIFLLELCRRTNRVLQLPFIIRHAHRKVASFRVFDIRKLDGLVVDPDFHRRYDEQIALGSQEQILTSKELDPLATSSPNLASLLDGVATNENSFSEDIMDTVTKVVHQHNDIDHVMLQDEEKLFEQIGEKVGAPRTGIFKNFSNAMKLCYWMEQGEWATSQPWCLCFCLRSPDKKMPDYLPSEFRPKNEIINNKVLKRNTMCGQPNLAATPVPEVMAEISSSSEKSGGGGAAAMFKDTAAEGFTFKSLSLDERFYCLKKWSKGAILMRRSVVWAGDNERLYYVLLKEPIPPVDRKKGGNDEANLIARKLLATPDWEAMQTFDEQMQKFREQCGWEASENHFNAFTTHSEYLLPATKDMWTQRMASMVEGACVKNWQRKQRSVGRSDKEENIISSFFDGGIDKSSSPPPPPSTFSIMYRRQWSYHMYHSTMMPYGLFQLHTVLSHAAAVILASPPVTFSKGTAANDEDEEQQAARIRASTILSIKKQLSDANRELEAGEERKVVDPSRLDPQLFTNADKNLVDDVFDFVSDLYDSANKSQTSVETYAANAEAVQNRAPPSLLFTGGKLLHDEFEERNTVHAELAKDFYEQLVGDLPSRLVPNDALPQDADASLNVTEDMVRCSDWTVYGGYGHLVVSDTHEDTSPTTTETGNAVRRFSKKLIRAMKRRYGDAPPDATAASQLPGIAVPGSQPPLKRSNVFLANRPLCIDTAGDPRARGIRPEVMKDIKEVLNDIFFKTDGGQDGGEVAPSAPTADIGLKGWRGLGPGGQFHSIREATLFVMGEGAGVTRQVLMRPNSTVIVVYDHFFTTPFWRHPAYHIHVARSLGTKLIFLTIYRGRYPIATDGTNIKEGLHRLLSQPEFVPGVHFLGAMNEGNGKGNGRQTKKIDEMERKTKDTWKPVEMETLKELTKGQYCCTHREGCG